MPDADTLDITDADAFATGLLRIPMAERAGVADDLMARQLERSWLLAPDDVPALAQHAYVKQLAFYGMEDAHELTEGCDAWENFAPELDLEAQVHPRLLEVFRSRPRPEQADLARAWWGPDVDRINDLMVLLAWSAGIGAGFPARHTAGTRGLPGTVELHRTPAYFDAVAELVVEVSRRHRDGIAYIAARPYLADDFIHAVTNPGCFAWLGRRDPNALAAHLRSLARAGAFDITQLLDLVDSIDQGLDNGWGGSSERRAAIGKMRAALTR